MATQQEIINEQGRQFAQQYLIFVDDPRGKNLLGHWQKAVLGRVLPPNASHAELAYEEGRRAFILSIQHQIELAGAGAPDPFG
jgi:hypothetical protein